MASLLFRFYFNDNRAVVEIYLNVAYLIGVKDFEIAFEQDSYFLWRYLYSVVEQKSEANGNR